ncbi:MAG: NUDIX hydrolase [Verrucomicrobiota bacterium]
MSSEKNPWKTKSTRIAFENPWISVIENEVVRPNGSDGNYTFVHFKRKAVAIVPVDEEGYTWLVGQYRYTLDRYSWEVPEGGSDPGEEPVDTARRELREETGLSAEQLDLILEMDLSNCVSDEVSFTFLARGLSEGEMAPDESEELKVRRVPMQEAMAMVERGEIRDALSIGSLHAAARAISTI